MNDVTNQPQPHSNDYLIRFALFCQLTNVASGSLSNGLSFFTIIKSKLQSNNITATNESSKSKTRQGTATDNNNNKTNNWFDDE